MTQGSSARMGSGLARDGAWQAQVGRVPADLRCFPVEDVVWRLAEGLL